MSSYFLEGESYFVLKELDKIVSGKKVMFDPGVVQSVSFVKKPDYYVLIDPNKETIESINYDNFIICLMDKNADLRLDYIKSIKKKAEIITFDPIPTTDFVSLKREFPNIVNESNFMPSKKVNLKYKGAKQNYEWFDICLISDLYKFNDPEIYRAASGTYFDIWSFTDGIWSGDANCLSQVEYITGQNFEDYFNRIRETSKDYLELIQTQAKRLSIHKKIYPESVITNDFRFYKIQEKLKLLKNGTELDSIMYFDECLKHVRQGANPKLELIKLFFKFKRNVL